MLKEDIISRYNADLGLIEYYLVSTIVDASMFLCETRVLHCDADGVVIGRGMPPRRAVAVWCSSSAEEALKVHQRYLSGEEYIFDLP